MNERELKQLTTNWLGKDFYNSAVVLGIDIGLEGIGLYLRRGMEEIFAKTILFDTPEPAPLQGRRAARAARHCRKNRKTRMHRLKLLFARHDLPWLDAERMSRSEPYKQRHRALTTGIASKEALSICIRSCVLHRGYDYGLDDEGQFPWGESNQLSEARKWVESSYITEEIRDLLASRLEELVAKKNPDKARKDFLDALNDRYAWSSQNTIEALLEKHSKGGHDNLRERARGYNFPRTQVWEHLVKIIRHPRHAALIAHSEKFIEELGINPSQPKSAPADRFKESQKLRRKAIFFFNRKSRLEMEKHWESKVKTCPYSVKLGLPETPCSPHGLPDVRRWKMLEFACTRRVELTVSLGKGPTKTTRMLLRALSAECVGKLMDLVERDVAALAANPPAQRPETEEIMAILKSDIPPHPDAKVEISPRTKSDWNDDFLEQLKNLALPNRANQAGRASVCHQAAKALYEVATAGGKSIVPDQFAPRLKAIGFYDWRRQASVDFNPYRQVEYLLGHRIKRGANQGALSESAQGFLRRIFAEHSELLEGKAAPDYCVIEVIGDIPRNTQQRAELQAEQKERAEKRKKAFESHNIEDSGVASRRRRITLHQQQDGICPFTGAKLPGPLDPSLEIEHVFPQSLGGLSCDENLVLTWREINSRAKGEHTPLQAVGRSAKVGPDQLQIQTMPKMVEITSSMRWSPRKREIFAWGTKTDPTLPDSHFLPNGSLKVPSFGTPTRVAQLARQLRAEVARWMEVDGPDQADEMTRRIGTPSGWLAAQARKSWLPNEDYTKIRSNLVHHLIDAAILAHIPPREGMNHVHCGGIFFTMDVRVGAGLGGVRVETHALEGLSPLPRIRNWLSATAEYAECPVFKPRSQSKTSTLGDSTFWRQVDPAEAHVAQRTALKPEKFADGEELHKALVDMKVGRDKATEKDPSHRPKFDDKIPSIPQLQKWLDHVQEASQQGKPYDALKLRDGTPVKNIWKWDSKGTLGSILGWSGSQNASGTLEGLRSLSDKFDRLELWLGYDHDLADKARKKKLPNPEAHGWVYQKRLIPDKRSLQHLKQLGFTFSRDKRKKAPIFCQDKPEQLDKHVSLRELIIGEPLLPFSVEVGRIRKGDVLRVQLSKDGEIVSKKEQAVWSAQYGVTAINTNTQVEMKCLTLKDIPLGCSFPVTENKLTLSPANAGVLASLTGLGTPSEEADTRGRRIPSRPPETPKEAKQKPKNPDGQSGLNL